MENCVGGSSALQIHTHDYQALPGSDLVWVHVKWETRDRVHLKEVANPRSLSVAPFFLPSSPPGTLGAHKGFKPPSSPVLPFQTPLLR